MSSKKPTHAAKQRIYEQFARISKALAAPARLELLDLLVQAERSVDALATATELSIANASQHLQVLAAARLVDSRRDGQRVLYRIADDSVVALLQSLRHTAEARLAELDEVARDYLVGRDDFEPIGRGELARRLRNGTVTLIDVRPPEEFAQGHIAGAVSVPVDEIEAFAKQARKDDKKVVAYCRGPYCVYAIQAVAALRKRGIDASRSEDGVAEWRAAGLPIAQGGGT
ncbi:MAG TPA: metalloregulator ArsR/SmtB family transcription factor [Kofleriaceae bacterium]|jgi:ArsR family transcriptional regulator|nr:metalloregulator ArsR/SmtB family transcription factor [Kofleriaceae bacterium]